MRHHLFFAAAHQSFKVPAVPALWVLVLVIIAYAAGAATWYPIVEWCQRVTAIARVWVTGLFMLAGIVFVFYLIMKATHSM